MSLLPEFFGVGSSVGSGASTRGAAAAAPPPASLNDLPLTGLPSASSFYAGDLLMPSSAAEVEDLASITGEAADAALWRSHANEYAVMQARSAQSAMVSWVRARARSSDARSVSRFAPTLHSLPCVRPSPLPPSPVPPAPPPTRLKTRKSLRRLLRRTRGSRVF